MKTTEFIVETSVIAQEADLMHADHEVQMARSQMYSAAHAAIEIHRLLKDISEMQGIEGWVASKLTLASQYLESVRDYLKYEAVSKESDLIPFAEAAAGYALDKILSEDEYAGWKDYAEKNPEKLNKGTIDLYARNTPRFGGDEGVPGAKSSRVDTGKGIATKVEKPEGVPKVSKIPITKFGGGGAGGGAGHLADPSQVKSMIPNFESTKNQKLKEMATGGASSAGSIATSMTGPAGKPGTGKPKKIANSHKTKKVTVGKGVY